MRPCKFYILNPSTGYAAKLDKHGAICGWDETLMWEDGARAFDTKPDAAIALYENSRLDLNCALYRIIRDICP